LKSLVGRGAGLPSGVDTFRVVLRHRLSVVIISWKAQKS